MSELGRGEAVVHLGHRELLARVGDAGLRVRVAPRSRRSRGTSCSRSRVGVARAVAGDERQRLDVDRLVGVLVRVLGPHDDRGGRAVGDARAVEHAEPAGHQRRVADRLHRDLLAELRARVARAVVVVLPRDAREHLAHLRRRRRRTSCRRPARAHREHRGRGERAAGAVGRRRGPRRRVPGSRCPSPSRRRSPSPRRTRRSRPRTPRCAALPTGRAEVLDVRDRLVVQLQRAGERHAAHSRHRGAEPVRVDVPVTSASRSEAPPPVSGLPNPRTRSRRGALRRRDVARVEKTNYGGFQGLRGPPPPNDGTGRTLTAAAMFSMVAPGYGRSTASTPTQMREVMARVASKNHYNGARNSRGSSAGRSRWRPSATRRSMAGDARRVRLLGRGRRFRRRDRRAGRGRAQYTDKPIS